MSTPGDSEKGKPAEDEQAEVEATEAKDAGSAQAAADAGADAPADAAGSAATGVSPTEGTAADITGVQKDAAAAALREGSSGPAPEDAGAAAEAQVVDAAGDGDADDAAVGRPVSEAEAPEAEAETAVAPARRRGRRGRRGKAGGAETAEDQPAGPKPEPARRGPARREGEQVLVRAQAKYVRTSARKARLVCDHIRGKSVQEARAVLAHTPRAAARDWSKLLESAIANAEHNHELIGDDLRVFAVTADEGPTLKRFRPRAMGRATRIRKRTSHLTITLTPKE